MPTLWTSWIYSASEPPPDDLLNIKLHISSPETIEADSHSLNYFPLFSLHLFTFLNLCRWHVPFEFIHLLLQVAPVLLNNYTLVLHFIILWVFFGANFFELILFRQIFFRQIFFGWVFFGELFWANFFRADFLSNFFLGLTYIILSTRGCSVHKNFRRLVYC